MKKQGFVIWLTGLSGAGKSTIATALESKLISMGNRVEVIDGDCFRDKSGMQLGFSKRDREINNNCMGYAANILSEHGIAVIVAAISPYREVRDFWKKKLKIFLKFLSTARLRFV